MRFGPDRYRVDLDRALECGDEVGEHFAKYGAELWHRPPEEWELIRVEHRKYTKVAHLEVRLGDVVLSRTENCEMSYMTRVGPVPDYSGIGVRWPVAVTGTFDI